MADVKISGLPASTTPLAGTEVLPIVQSGVTKKVASDDLTVKNVRSNATNWYDVDVYTAPTQEVGFDPEYTYYRAGVKTGAYTSGDVVIRFGSEDKEEH